MRAFERGANLRPFKSVVFVYRNKLLKLHFRKLNI